MNKRSMAIVVIAASFIFSPILATQSLFDAQDRKAINAWIHAYYKPLNATGKKMLLTLCQSNKEMLAVCEKAINDSATMTDMATHVFGRIWHSSSEIIKDQSATEVIDFVRAINALNQLRLDWLRKIVVQYQQHEPGFLERILVRFSQKGKFKLYRELNTLFKWSKEIVDQFVFFEDELLKSL